MTDLEKKHRKKGKKTSETPAEDSAVVHEMADDTDSDETSVISVSRLLRARQEEESSEPLFATNEGEDIAAEEAPSEAEAVTDEGPEELTESGIPAAWAACDDDNVVREDPLDTLTTDSEEAMPLDETDGAVGMGEEPNEESAEDLVLAAEPAEEGTVVKVEENLLPAPDANLDQELDVVEPLFPEQLHFDGKIEAIVFASPKPIRATEITEILLNDGDEVTAKQVEQVLRQLHQQYRERRGGFHLAYMKGEGYQFQTVKAAAPIMERLFSERPRPLSRASLETLSIIAYRQPVTRADVEYIRGVDAGNIIKNLMDRNLVACVGRKEDAGRPMVFGTTDEFLKIFRINSVNDLPPLSSFQPAPDLIAQAQEMLAQREDMVDVEPYIADMEKPAALVSGGVLDQDEVQGARRDVEGAEEGPVPTPLESELAKNQAGGELDQDEIQGFIGDEELSPLLTEDKPIDAENSEPPMVEEGPSPAEESSSTGESDAQERAYASVADAWELSEEVPEHDGNADSETTVSTGDSVPPGSGEDDPGREDLS